jgi:hypothetical protein
LVRADIRVAVGVITTALEAYEAKRWPTGRERAGKGYNDA